MDPNVRTTGPAAAGAVGSRRRPFLSALRRLKSRRMLAVLFITTGLTWLLWARCGIRGCPPVERLVSYQPGGAPVILDRGGKPFARLTPVPRQVVRIDSLPAHVPAAFVAVEDRRFYRHAGIDWIRVVGAALANVRAGRTVQGSSTITMQLARNVFPDRIRSQERTLRRKLLEARVARRIEKRFTKDEILELYLNHIYFGNGAYGVEAASRHYFGRSASALSVEQAALLAALPKAPSHYDPRRRSERARARRDLVLTAMARTGTLTAEAAEQAKNRPVRVARPSDARRVGTPNAPYFVQAVRAELEERFGEDLWTRSLVIHTGLDPAVQRAFEEVIEAQLRRVEAGQFGRFSGPRRAGFDAADGDPAYLQAAAAAVDPVSGEVRALVGGRDWVHSRFDRAQDARRQVGSAFKPFVFATALSEGWSAWDWLEDSPYRRVSRGSADWEPSNFDGRFAGPVTVREALILSRNVPTVRLAEAVGTSDVARVARAAGLRGDIPESPVIALGVTESSPLELATAYAIFANGGASVTARLVTRVEDRDGRVLHEARPESSTRVLDPRIAERMTHLLRDAVDQGTGRAVRTSGYRGPAAGKTGTTNDGADAWFVGYTPTLVASVWVGFDRPRPIAARVSGGTVAAEIWGRALRQVGAGGGWPDRFARSEDEEWVEVEPRRESRRPDATDRGPSWLRELFETERARLRRETHELLHALTEELEDVVGDLPLERDARREVQHMLRRLGRELERMRREYRDDTEQELRRWLDEELPREIRRAIPESISIDGREIRIGAVR